MELLIEDSVLVKDYMNGDERALEKLIDRHNQRLSSFIYSKVQDREITEDIFQDTFIRVMRISHNLIIDYFRKNKRMPRFEGNNDFNIFSIISDDQLNAERRIIKDQIDQDLTLLIKELPKDQMEVLEMRLYKDMSFKEISENTGVSINTALGRMRYALINLRKIVEKNNIILTN